MKKKPVKKRSIRKTVKKAAPKKKPSRKKPSVGSRKSLQVNKIKKKLATNSILHLLGSRQKGLDFPATYGETRLVLLARDPWWIYAYWEITPKREREALALMSSQGARGARRVLRVYRQKSHFEAPFFDIDLGNFADNWYVEVGIPGELWVSEIGLRSKDGRFYPLARSNSVRTPCYGISGETDPDWRLPQDTWGRLFEASGAFLDSKSSFDLAKNDTAKEKNG